MNNIFLPPPYIEEKLPAQYPAQGFLIPFSLNRAVGPNDFSALSIKIKTASTNREIKLDNNKGKLIIKNNMYYALFILSDNDKKKFTFRQFYKAQIAFITNVNEKDNIGEYSTVGIFKYTTNPEIKILDMFKNELQDSEIYQSKIFLGAFIEHPEDPTEKVEAYKFEIYDENGKLFDATDFLLHDMANDHRKLNIQENSYASLDTYCIKKEMSPVTNYFIRYIVQTTGGIILSSRFYRFIETNAMSLDFPGKLEIQENSENGYLCLRTTFTQDRLFNGSFRLLRTDERSNFQQWEEIKKIYFDMRDIDDGQAYEFFKDFSLEQGIKYQYAIQQFFKPEDQEGNKQIEPRYFKKDLFIYQIYPNGTRRIKPYFMLNFEDMFLSDGDRQLRIAFNPKVSSFKDHILENKIDTMGGKFPFFFRNGNVCYKEFPISGLITCHMDNNKFFMVHEDINTDLTYSNIAEERKFKQEVLKWLSNGKPKLFRSPTEGNYIVQLMKVSLKPEDRLGRMLHNFSATAYEAMEYNYENIFNNNFLLGKLGMIRNEKINHNPGFILKVKTLTNKKSTINIPKAIYAKVTNNKNTLQTIELKYFDGEKVDIAIGYTKYYNIQIDRNNPLMSVSLLSSADNSNLTIEYGYYNENKFKDTAFDYDNYEICSFNSTGYIEQYIGTDTNTNILSSIIHPSSLDENHTRRKIEEIPSLIIKAKSIQNVWIKDNLAYNYKVYINKSKDIEMQLKDSYNEDTILHPQVEDKAIQHLCDTVIYYGVNTEKYYTKGKNNYLVEMEYPLDYSYLLRYTDNDKSSADTSILQEKYIEMDLTDISHIDSLQIGNALYVEIFYILTTYQVRQPKEWME